MGINPVAPEFDGILAKAAMVRTRGTVPFLLREVLKAYAREGQEELASVVNLDTEVVIDVLARRAKHTQEVGDSLLRSLNAVQTEARDREAEASGSGGAPSAAGAPHGHG